MATTANSLGFPFLTIIVFLPGVAGVLLGLTPENFAARQIRQIAGVAAVLDFILAMVLLVKFKTSTPASGLVMQFVDRHTWVSPLGINYIVGVDGVAVFLVGLTTLIMAIAILAGTYMIDNRVKSFMVFMLVLETGILGVFVALNVFLFYVFWEAMLIPMYFLLGMWGERGRVRATMKFLIYTIFGSFLMLVAIFYLWVQNGTLDMVGSGGLIAHPVSGTAQDWLFLAFAIAFAIKLPLWPFHTWAPDAYAEAPVPVVIALSGILSKAGAFGFIRYCLPLFPNGVRDFGDLVAVLAIVGILYAAGMALVQNDIKRIVAFASVSHMNLIALGIFALSATGINGSTLQMINHSMIITGLFLAVAFIVARTGTRYLTEMGGLGERWPYLMWLFFVFILAGLDLPGLSSFSGEFLILIGVFQHNAWFASIAALTVIITAWYMIRFFQDSMNGPVTASPTQAAVVAEEPGRTPYEFPVLQPLISRDLLPREVMLFVPLLLLIIYLGIQPNALTSRVDPTASAVSSLATRVVVLGLGGGR